VAEEVVEKVLQHQEQVALVVVEMAEMMFKQELMVQLTLAVVVAVLEILVVLEVELLMVVLE
jgi:hypothetical protein